MISPDFDPMAQLEHCQSELIRQGLLLKQVIKQNSDICDMLNQQNNHFNSLAHKFNQMLKDHKHLQVKVALMDPK